VGELERGEIYNVISMGKNGMRCAEEDAQKSPSPYILNSPH
jgi:hypothetical protein